MAAAQPPVFRNYGGHYQLRLEKPDDLTYLALLKIPRWAATSAPVSCFRCDPAVLKTLDPDGSGRIRTQDLKDAQQWLFRFLANRERMTQQSELLRLDDLDTSHPAGKQLREAADWVMQQLEISGEHELSLTRLRTFRDSYAAVFPNGDGIVPMQDIADEETKVFAAEVIKYTGALTDLAGKHGYDQAKLNEFVARGEKIRAWRKRGRKPEADDMGGESGAAPVDPGLWVWGDDTAQAALCVFELDQKIEQFFWHCDVLKVQPNAGGLFQVSEFDLRAIDLNDPKAVHDRLAAAPLAQPNADGVLDLGGTVNPIFAEQVAKLRAQVVARARAEHADRDAAEHLTRDEWRRIKKVFEPFKAWHDSKPQDALAELPEAKLNGYLDGEVVTRARELIAKDLDVADELEQLIVLEKVLMLQRWLMEIANNFVNFSQLYNPEKRALFEDGSLVIDGRQLAFTMRVHDRAEHKKIAETSQMFLIYAEITACEPQTKAAPLNSAPGAGAAAPGPAGTAAPNLPERFEIVAAVTSGQIGGIGIGKRGVFFDVLGREWDARVVDVVNNPISLWEAIKAPFAKAGKLIMSKIEQIAVKETETLEKAADKGLKEITAAPPPGSPAPPATPPAPATPSPAPIQAQAAPSSTRDLLVGGGVFFAAVGSSLAFMLKTVSEIKPLHIALAAGSLVAVVVFFSGLLGLIKLRRRDMSAMLEAAGWAVNYRMMLTRNLGKLFTRRPGLPRDAIKERRDLTEVFLAKTGDGGVSAYRIALATVILLALGLAATMYFYPAEVAQLIGL